MCHVPRTNRTITTQEIRDLRVLTVCLRCEMMYARARLFVARNHHKVLLVELEERRDVFLVRRLGRDSRLHVVFLQERASDFAFFAVDPARHLL